MQTAAKTIWDCRQAQVELALKAGGDLEDPIALALLEAHLTDCPACRRYLAGMEATLEMLQASTVETLSAERPPSLWPRVAQRLPRGNSRIAYAQFNVWVPTAAMAAACAAMILVTIVQLERVSPFEPLMSPTLRTALSQESPDRFVDDRHFAEGRMPDSSAAPVFRGATPVKFPLEMGRYPAWEFPIDSERSAGLNHREW